jgi:hypothetical protein
MENLTITESGVASIVAVFHQTSPLNYLVGSEHDCEVDTYDDYRKFLKMRHDLCHILIAKDLDMPTREIAMRDLIDIKDDSWELVGKQSPDMVTVQGKMIKIAEVTVSDSPEARDRKLIKYSLLLRILRDQGYTVDLMIFVISLSPEKNRRLALTDDCISDINYIINRANKKLGKIHSTPTGSAWYKKFTEAVDTRYEDQIHVTTQDVIDQYKTLSNTTMTEKELDKILFDEYIEPNMDHHFEDCLQLVKRIKVPFFNKDDPVTEWDKANTNQFYKNGPLTEDLPSILKIPYFGSRPEPFEYTTNGKDSLLFNQSQMNKKFPLNVLDRNALVEIGREGPGRKNLIKKNILVKTKDERSGKVLNPASNTDLVNNMVSNIVGSGEETILMNAEIYQEIYRTIAILSTFKDHEDGFVSQWTNSNILVLLFPGPRMRQSNNPSVIWFKLFFRNGCHLMLPFTRSLSMVGEVCSTKWISCDTQQIDHFLRYRDRLEMASLAFSETTGDLSKVDLSFLAHVFITYSEYKRCTSNYFQDYRFIMMNACSINKNWADMMERFDQPIRSTWQLHHWKKIRSFLMKVREDDFTRRFKFYEKQDADLEDEYSGSESYLPRMISDGPDYSFKSALCEMYFSILYNKDQANPAHDEMKILDKILWGEKQFQKYKSMNGPVDGAVKEPFMRYQSFWLKDSPGCFSAEAIQVGSLLQSRSESCSAPNGLAHDLAVNSGNLCKNLDEFATFKSSLSKASDHYVGKESIIKRKCINEVLPLIEKNLRTNFDVLNKFKDWVTKFVVFKKNQIGVREILILTIVSRIIINILETISRNICKLDSREMLTDGQRKYTQMRDISRRCYAWRDKVVTFFLNLDKSKWGPRFNPTQFIYMYLPFKKRLGCFWPVIVLILLKHQSKRCYLPSTLMKLFAKNQDVQSTNPDLNTLKEDFLKTHRTYFVNESNMGQGILHYTSSYAHLCMISHCQELFKRACKQRGINVNSVKIHVLLSSDDSQIWLSVFKSKDPKMTLVKLVLFLKCMTVSERLFNMKTGMGKSCISLIVQEFNSAFGSALSFYPTLIKFCLSSVPNCRTDSFHDAVNECFSAVNQLKENGASVLLCNRAHELNKGYCEHVFRSSEIKSMVEEIGINWKNFPYHLGRYPDYGHMGSYIFGPKFDSYVLLKETLHTMNDIEKSLVLNSHRLIDHDELEVMSNLIDPEEIRASLVTIRASMSPMKILNIMKLESGVEKEEIEEYIEKNPYFLFRDAQTPLECKYKTVMKLYGTGAAKALRMTSGVMYYARYVASRSSNAFRIGNGEVKTYRNCIMDIIEKESIMKSNPFLELLFPEEKDMHDLYLLSHKLNFVFSTRPSSAAMMIRNLSVTNHVSPMSNPAFKVIDVAWFDRKIPGKERNQYKRDFETLKKIFPIKDTFEETLMSFSGTLREKIRALVLIIMKMKTKMRESIKMFAYGRSTDSLESTIYNIFGKNYDPSLDMNVILGRTTESISKMVDLRTRYNLSTMLLMEGKIKDSMRILNLNLDDFNKILVSKRFPFWMKKSMIFRAKSIGLIDKHEFYKYTSVIELPVMSYIIPQEQKDDQWIGTLSVECSIGKDSAHLYFDKGGFSGLNFSKGVLPRYKKLLFDALMRNFPDEMQCCLVKEGKGNYAIMGDEITNSRGTILASDSWISTTERMEPEILIGSDRLECWITPRTVMKSYYDILPGDTHSLDDDGEVFGLSIRDISRYNLLSNPNPDTIPDNDIAEMINDANMPIPIISTDDIDFIETLVDLSTISFELDTGENIVATDVYDEEPINVMEYVDQALDIEDMEMPDELMSDAQTMSEEFELEDIDDFKVLDDYVDYFSSQTIMPSKVSIKFMRNMKWLLLGKVLVSRNLNWNAVKELKSPVARLAACLYLLKRLNKETTISEPVRRVLSIFQ